MFRASLYPIPLLAALCLFASSCNQTRACKDDTVMLAVDLQGTATAASTLQVQVKPDIGNAVSGIVNHKPNTGGGTIEVKFPDGYPAGQNISIGISAVDAQGLPVGYGSTSQVLGNDCMRITVAVAALVGVDGGDGSSPDALEGGNCPGVCIPGQEVPCGKCGKRVCTSDCTWAACDGEGACAAGESRTCGNCGTEFCNSECKWNGCMNSKACAAGASEKCGNCGLRSCSSQCEWGACENDGACAPGAEQACGKCGKRVCSGGASLACGWGECQGEGVCSPGATEACGNCGTRTCTTSCGWGPCTGEGVCKAGSTRGCGNCGTQTCSNTCTWAASCTGQGACSPGSESLCGACNDGVQICSPTCTLGRCVGGTACCRGNQCCLSAIGICAVDLK